ncbi:WD40-repeat-containing domain protein [Baffinella frigidus]|nr:WD40-repeat-containing domain protein [Cryptophyta sp. CCMP2293]
MTPGGKLLVTGGRDCTVRVWNPEGGYQLAVFYHKQTVTCVSANDERFVASGSDDCSVKVWDLQKKKEEGAYVGHHMAIAGVDLSGSGRLVTSSHDGSTKVWSTLGKVRFSFPESALTPHTQGIVKAAVRVQAVSANFLVSQTMGQYPVLRVFQAATAAHSAPHDAPHPSASRAAERESARESGRSPRLVAQGEKAAHGERPGPRSRSRSLSLEERGHADRGALAADPAGQDPAPAGANAAGERTARFAAGVVESSSAAMTIVGEVPIPYVPSRLIRPTVGP